MSEAGMVELAEAIDAVRAQLVAAQKLGLDSAAGDALRFAVGKVSIQFSGEVSTTGGGSGGVKFWVVAAEAKAERTSGASHTVTVELIPQTPQGASFVVSDNLDALPSQ